MAKYYIRGKSSTSFGRAKEFSDKEIRALRKSFSSLKFVKVKSRK